MTVGIASICSFNNDTYAIIFCSDRLKHDGLRKYESGDKKYRNINGRGIILGSGSWECVDEVFLDRQVFSSNQDKTIEEVADKIQKKLKEILRRKKEDQVLSKYDLNFDKYIKENKNLSDKLLSEISEGFSKVDYEFDNEFLLAGFDPDNTPQLYMIGKYGKLKQTLNSFAIIGSGRDLSRLEFTKNFLSIETDLTEAILRVYRAKKLAENGLEVGFTHDVGIIYLEDANESSKETIRNVGIYEIPFDVEREIRSVLDTISKFEKKSMMNAINKLRKIIEGEDSKEEIQEKLDEKKE